MKTFKLKTHHKTILADTLSPVSIYLKIRDKFPNSILLESSDYHGNENSFSYICFNPIASLKIEGDTIYKTYPDKSKEEYTLTPNNTTAEIDKFTNLIREFNKHVKNDKSIKQIILPIGDGFTICRKI